MTTIFPAPFTIIDTETTGFQSGSSVLEIGAARVERDGTISKTYQALCSPREWNSGWEKAFAIHGISQDMVEGHPGQADSLAAFIDWWKGDADGALLTAWNMGFDKRMLGYMGDRAAELAWHKCLMEACATAHLKYTRRWKLSVAADSLGLSWEGVSHRAMADVMMSANVAIRVLGRTNQGDPGATDTDARKAT